MTVRMDDDEKALISDYARIHGATASQFMRRCALDRIEEDIDVDEYKKAIAAYRSNPVSYTLDEVEGMLGL